MNATTIFLATGNPAKAELLGSLLNQHGIAWESRDPGDAEDHAPIGYESAVRAKVAALGDLAELQPVLAHDSGYEFHDLGGRPGPDTKSWLRAARDDLLHGVSPGGRVDAVHWVALLIEGEVHLFHDADERRVPATTTIANSELPLSDTFIGPRQALSRLIEQCVAVIRAAGPIGDSPEQGNHP